MQQSKLGALRELRKVKNKNTLIIISPKMGNTKIEIYRKPACLYLLATVAVMVVFQALVTSGTLREREKTLACPAENSTQDRDLKL